MVGIKFKKAPIVALKTDVIGQDLYFEAWREGIKPFFDCVPIVENDYQINREKETKLFLLDNVVLAKSNCDRQLIKRDRHWRQKNDGTDNFMIIYVNRGDYNVFSDNIERYYPKGTVFVLDLSKELLIRMNENEGFSLSIPRSLMAHYFENLDELHHFFIPPELIRANSIKNSFLKVLHLTENHSKDIASIFLADFLQLLAEFFRPKINIENDLVLSAIRAQIISYIQMNADQFELNVSDICRTFNCSRAKLYRILQPYGGVSKIIRNTRLNECWAELANQDCSHKKIIEISTKWGIDDYSAFSKTFKRHYGMRPSDVRDYYKHVPQ